MQRTKEHVMARTSDKHPASVVFEHLAVRRELREPAARLLASRSGEVRQFDLDTLERGVRLPPLHQPAKPIGAVSRHAIAAAGMPMHRDRAAGSRARQLVAAST